MAILEKITQEDLYLYEILKNPVLCAEFIANYDKIEQDEPFKLNWYQEDILCDFNNYVSICCARAIGKTQALVLFLTWCLIFNVYPEQYIIYFTPNKVHLEPVWAGLIRNFRGNTFLKYFIQQNAGINSGDFKIMLQNGAVLMCRIAGNSGTGANVVGLHTPCFIIDESGYQPWQPWIELQPTINTFSPGFKLIVSGVPDGRREKSVCYYADQEDSTYSKHRISALQNPRFSEEDHEKALQQYGGKDSEDYAHYVLGTHGKPVFALFDRSLLAMQQYPVYKLELGKKAVGENFIDLVEKFRLIPMIPDKSYTAFFGIDLGYTEPTAIYVLYYDRQGIIRIHCKIKLTQVSYPIQEKLIDLLDSKFNPAFIGMDEGNAGKAVRQHLLESDEFIHKNYAKRFISVDFSSSISIGIDTNGEEIKTKTKPFSVSVLQSYSNDHKIIYSTTDLETVVELERMTYIKTPSGEIMYRTMTDRGGMSGSDHFTSAMLCGIMAYYLNLESINNRTKRSKLINPGWIR